jgi:hypothetical protein
MAIVYRHQACEIRSTIRHQFPPISVLTSISVSKLRSETSYNGVPIRREDTDTAVEIRIHLVRRSSWHSGRTPYRRGSSAGARRARPRLTASDSAIARRLSNGRSMSPELVRAKRDRRADDRARNDAPRLIHVRSSRPSPFRKRNACANPVWRLVQHGVSFLPASPPFSPSGATRSSRRRKPHFDAVGDLPVTCSTSRSLPYFELLMDRDVQLFGCPTCCPDRARPLGGAGGSPTPRVKTMDRSCRWCSGSNPQNHRLVDEKRPGVRGERSNGATAGDDLRRRFSGSRCRKDLARVHVADFLAETLSVAGKSRKCNSDCP